MLPCVTNAVLCPRCRYDLRAITQPRCPECGLAFTWQAWQSGLIRVEVPSAMDRVDPWQPHAVLWAALVELSRCAVSPKRALSRISLDGPWHTTPLVLIVGALWVYVAVVAILACATGIHANVSPYVATRNALLVTAPRTTACSLVAAFLAFVLVATPARTCVASLSPRGWLRLAAHWTPAVALYAAVPWAVAWLISPELGAGAPSFAPLLPLVALLPQLVRGPWSRSGRLGVGRLQVALACLLLWTVGVPLAGFKLLPDSLEPPLWVFPP